MIMSILKLTIVFVALFAGLALWPIHSESFSANREKDSRGTSRAFGMTSFTAGGSLTPQGGMPEEMQKAQSLIGAKDFDGAIQILEEFTRKNPNRLGAWNMLAGAYLEKGELDKAFHAYEIAAQAPPLQPAAYFNIAGIYAIKKDKENAFKYLHRVRDTGSFDMDQLLIDPHFEGLREDPRLKELIPRPEDFENPFVEKVRIIHEWAGEAKGSQFGWIARKIGDVDGDRITDFTVSAPTYAVNGQPAGRIYVYSSKSAKLLWQQTGQTGEDLGMGVESAGDTNRDGIPDVIAGSPAADRAYIYSGRDGKLLLTLTPANKGESFGNHVSTAGDVNGDKFADVLVGAPGLNASAGHAYVFSGKDGSLLLTLSGEQAGDAFGNTVTGYKDKTHSLIIVGAPGAGPRKTGRVYVYEGLSKTPRFVFDSDQTGGRFGGMFLSVLGDVNADKIPDIYVSDWNNSAKGNATGRIYIYSGKDGKTLITLTGESQFNGFGIGPADAGDMNGDGCADLIIGAWQYSGAAMAGGRVYLFSGKDSSLLETYTGRIPGETLGFDATGIGDVDGDGTIDFLLTSAWSGIKGFRSGRVYIVSGRIPK
jgi:hypothetical protein